MEAIYDAILEQLEKLKTAFDKKPTLGPSPDRLGTPDFPISIGDLSNQSGSMIGIQRAYNGMYEDKPTI